MTPEQLQETRSFPLAKVDVEGASPALVDDSENRVRGRLAEAKFVGADLADAETLPAFERTAAEVESRIGFLLAAIDHTTDTEEGIEHA